MPVLNIHVIGSVFFVTMQMRIRKPNKTRNTTLMFYPLALAVDVFLLNIALNDVTYSFDCEIFI